MSMETANEQLNIDYKDMQLHQMKIELLEFLQKMKSNGFLKTVEFQDIPTDIKQIYNHQ
ncbi:hypothetical protein [Sporosarcina sp. FSL K6-2383]|uniref:hypothetical protein n=1 Tax=Sporosarcina sp. FSL K6-2383 TaxID=2921556 RepID=UPI00315A1896